MEAGDDPGNTQRGVFVPRNSSFKLFIKTRKYVLGASIAPVVNHAEVGRLFPWMLTSLCLFYRSASYCSAPSRLEKHIRVSSTIFGRLFLSTATEMKIGSHPSPCFTLPSLFPGSSKTRIVTSVRAAQRSSCSSSEPSSKILKSDLLALRGIGPVNASLLAAQGITTIDTLQSLYRTTLKEEKEELLRYLTVCLIGWVGG